MFNRLFSDIIDFFTIVVHNQPSDKPFLADRAVALRHTNHPARGLGADAVNADLPAGDEDDQRIVADTASRAGPVAFLASL